MLLSNTDKIYRICANKKKTKKNVYENFQL